MKSRAGTQGTQCGGTQEYKEKLNSFRNIVMFNLSSLSVEVQQRTAGHTHTHAHRHYDL